MTPPPADAGDEAEAFAAAERARARRPRRRNRAGAEIKLTAGAAETGSTFGQRALDDAPRRLFMRPPFSSLRPLGGANLMTNDFHRIRRLPPMCSTRSIA